MNLGSVCPGPCQASQAKSGGRPAAATAAIPVPGRFVCRGAPASFGEALAQPVLGRRPGAGQPKEAHHPREHQQSQPGLSGNQPGSTTCNASFSELST